MLFTCFAVNVLDIRNKSQYYSELFVMILALDY